jgi:hypothetical protein
LGQPLLTIQFHEYYGDIAMENKENTQKGKVNNPEGHNQYTDNKNKSGSAPSKIHNPEGHNQYTKKDK